MLWGEGAAWCALVCQLLCSLWAAPLPLLLPRDPIKKLQAACRSISILNLPAVILRAAGSAVPAAAVTARYKTDLERLLHPIRDAIPVTQPLPVTHPPFKRDL